MTRWLVLGGGSAGCVVASRLTEDESNEVTLLEAGEDHGPAPVPGDVGPFASDWARLWPNTTVIRHTGTAPEPYLQGRGLGGSSLVNGGVVVSDPLDPDASHLIPTEVPAGTGAVGDALTQAAPDAHPVATARRDGVRVTAADAYLRHAMPRPNLTVVTGSPVRRLIVDGRRVLGVVTIEGIEYLADRVVVCAGAIQTPTILLRSGIDTPGVGAGLQDHPSLSIALRLDLGAVDASVPTITAMVDRPGRQIMALNHLPGLGMYGALVAALMTVRSRGRITLPDPVGSPLVELNALDDPADLDGLVVVTMETLDLLRHDAMQAIVRDAFVDDAGTPASQLIGDEAAVRAWLPTHLSGYCHVAASCRMGVVTDESAAVRGYEGLRICDASLFPGVPAVNPYLSVITLAERLVARWRGQNAA